MYTRHFELHEAPFSLTPDPRFVYLSERHREALAHLLFGLEESGGFVQLTGEVGTGKTTICRTLLSQLPEQIDAALIFNPVLTVGELLVAICQELQVKLSGDNSSVKALTDALYEHLLEANAAGRRSILIIDEAQNLSIEVLEQIRLLTNLETNEKKLLQVFLIGQPELRSVLGDKNLRQLAQRITARYHLEPLGRNDTEQYIRHRLEVAGRSDVLFTKSAIRVVHRLTDGIPRLINVLCDRALLGAYANGRHTVDAGLVRRAKAEVSGEIRGSRLPAYLNAAAIILVAGLAISGAIAAIDEGRALRSLGAGWWPTDAPRHIDPLEKAKAAVPLVSDLAAMESATQSPASDPAPIDEPTLVRVHEARAPDFGVSVEPVSPPEIPSLPNLQAALHELTPADSASAIERLLWRWNLRHAGAVGELCNWAAEQDFGCRTGTTTWENLRKYDLPALLALQVGERDPVHVLLESLTGPHGSLFAGGRMHTFEPSDLAPHWRGNYVLLWKTPVKGLIAIKPGDRGEAVTWLRERLARVDGIRTTGERDFADKSLVRRVKNFQRLRKIAVDGVVGSETLINLGAVAPDLDRPSLSRSHRLDEHAHQNLARGDP